jgi:hypothetical protein
MICYVQRYGMAFYWDLDLFKEFFNRVMMLKGVRRPVL